jgi:putative FmdB family regulatory protein
MPIFEFHCSDCGNVFEEFRKTTAEFSAECHRCGSPARRIMSSVNVNFENWQPERRALIADALGDDVPVSRIPKRAFREI